MTRPERPPPLHAVIEAARAAALRSYHLVDALPAAELQPFVAAAATCMGRPIAALALVYEDSVCLDPAIGLDQRWTGRAGSVWDHAIAEPGPMVVADAQADARFYDRPLSWGTPELRFYAGVTLRDADGYDLGALCVLDRAPGRADPRALGYLGDIAQQAVAQLAVHRDRLLSAPPAAPAPEAVVTTWLGVRTKSAGRSFGRSRPGLIVLSVASESPAARAALRPTDVLVSIDGTSLFRPADVAAALADKPPGDTALVRVIRGGHVLERSLTLEAAPPRKLPPPPRA